MMKVHSHLITLIGITLAVLISCSSKARASDSYNFNATTPIVTAKGTSEVHTNADLALVTMQILNWNKDLHTAYSENSERTKRLLDVAKKNKNPDREYTDQRVKSTSHL